MNKSQAYKEILILSIGVVTIAITASLIFPGFCFADDSQESENFEENSENAENQKNEKIDENQEQEMEEAGDTILEISEDSEAEASDGLVDTIIFSSKDFYKTRALPCFTKAGDWLTNLWQSSIKPKVDKAAEWAHISWTQKVKPFVQNNIDKIKNSLQIKNRENYLKTELKKEKEEIKQESPYLYKIFDKYEGFKEFIWGSNGTSTQETNENSE